LEPHEKHGRLTTQSDLPDSVYAFPKQRKEPLTNAQHVRNAVARFDRVIDVPDAGRALAFANIKKAANYYDVNLAETSWQDLGIHILKVVPVFSKFDRKTLQFMAEAVRDGKLVIPISRTLPLSEAAEAHAAAQKGGIGKILLVA
jgi:NADPH:quinone reductase-like Zn-dependent oxidoreductase